MELLFLYHDITNHLIKIIFLLTTIFILLYLYFTRHFNYWKNRNVPFVTPTPFLGNLGDCLMIRTSMADTFGNLYNKTKEPYLGFFLLDKPSLLIRDTKIIQNILVNDFQTFSNRYVMTNKRDDPIGSQGLFFMRNPKWKKVRNKISPVYTSAKLKSMSVLMETACNQMDIYLKESLSKNKLVDVKSLAIKYIVNVLSSTAFGDPENSFTKNGEKYFLEAERLADWDNFLTSFRLRCYFLAHSVVNIFGMTLFPPKSIKFFKENFWQAIAKRTQSGINRNDLINYILQLKHDKDLEMDDDVLASQSMIFFVAGFETSNAVISYALLELALNYTVQNKLRDEISNVSEQFGGINYDSLKEMHYLDMVVKETLRKYPSLPFLDRCTNSSYKIPNTDVVLEKNTPVFISIYGLHHDPTYYPDPEKFDPERFSPENESTINPFAYLPFGQGPRICIGQRFGNTIVKFAIASILNTYEISTTSKGDNEIRFHPGSLTLNALDEILLEFKPVIGKDSVCAGESGS